MLPVDWLRLVVSTGSSPPPAMPTSSAKSFPPPTPARDLPEGGFLVILGANYWRKLQPISVEVFLFRRPTKFPRSRVLLITREKLLSNFFAPPLTKRSTPYRALCNFAAIRLIEVIPFLNYKRTTSLALQKSRSSGTDTSCPCPV